MSMQDLPSIDPEASPEAHRETILEAANQRKQQLEEKKQHALDALKSEHGGEVVETNVELGTDLEATIKVKLNGQLLKKMGKVDDHFEKLSDYDYAAREICNIVAGMLVEEEYDEELFYQLYLDEGEKPLMQVIDSVFGAIREEQKQRREGVDQFR